MSKKKSDGPKNPEDKKMTDFQKAWFESFVVHRDSTRAARDAGSKDPNKVGHKTRWLPHVAKAISEFEAAAMKRAETEHDKIINELKKLAFDDFTEAHIGDIMEWDDHGVRMKKSVKLTPKAMKAIKKIKPVVNMHGDFYGCEIELKDAKVKIAALAKLGDRFGTWKLHEKENPNGGTNPDGPTPAKESRDALLARVSGLVSKHKRSGDQG